MGVGISISVDSGKVDRRPLARSLLSPGQRRAEALVKKRFENDPQATIAMLSDIQKALAVKVSLPQMFARAQWCVRDTTDGTMRQYFEYVGLPPGLEANETAKSHEDKATATKKGDQSWKRKPSFGPYWEGEDNLDGGWCLILAHVALEDGKKPSRYARALVKCVIASLKTKQGLANVSILDLIEKEDWDKVEAMVRVDPTVTHTWGHQPGDSQGLSCLQFGICHGIPSRTAQIILSANPELAKEKTRNGTACAPLWQVCRNFKLQRQRRSTDPPSPGSLQLQREIFIADPFQCTFRGPDKAFPLDDVSPKFLLDRRVLQTIADLQCPRLARRAVRDAIPLEAALEVDDLSIEYVAKLLWLYPDAVNHRVKATRRLGMPHGQMVIGLVLERALFEHLLQSELLPRGTLKLDFTDVDPRTRAQKASSHVVDRLNMEQASAIDAKVTEAIPRACLGWYVPVKGTGKHPFQIHNRHIVLKQYHGVSTSGTRRRNKLKGPPPEHFMFMSAARKVWMVAAEVGQEKGYLLRMKSFQEEPTNAVDGTGNTLPSTPWQVLTDRWRDVEQIACWREETKMEKLHRLLQEAIQKELLDKSSERTIHGKLAHSKNALDDCIKMLEKRLASLTTLPTIRGSSPSQSNSTTLAKEDISTGGDRAGHGKTVVPKRYRQLLELFANLHPDGWLKFAEENPKHALQLVQCKLDEGEVLAVHRMMTNVKPKAPPGKLCSCLPCSTARERAREVAALAAKEKRLKEQLEEMRRRK